MNKLSTEIITFKHRTRDIHYQRNTLVIENQAHIDMDQIKTHNIDSYTHGNISHQQKH